MTNPQRALWTFLIYALLGPFLAALTVAALLPLAASLGVLAQHAPAGQAALAAFVWAIVPAALVALALAGETLRSGGFGWVLAATVGVVAFIAAAALLPFGLEGARPYLAFLAGLIAVGVREALVRMGILPS